MSKFVRCLIAVALVFITSDIYAAGGGGDHSHEGLTWESVDPHSKTTIKYQAINVALLAALLIYLGRNLIRDHLAQKKESFYETIKRVERTKADAERRNSELKQRIENLDSSSQASMETAEKEARELQAKIVNEAEHASKNIREEAARVASSETQKAIQHLREEVVSKALGKSRSVLRDKMQDPDQRRLQKEFVEKIQVVQR